MQKLRKKELKTSPLHTSQVVLQTGAWPEKPTLAKREDLEPERLVRTPGLPLPDLVTSGKLPCFLVSLSSTCTYQCTYLLAARIKWVSEQWKEGDYPVHVSGAAGGGDTRFCIVPERLSPHVLVAVKLRCPGKLSDLPRDATASGMTKLDPGSLRPWSGVSSTPPCFLLPICKPSQMWHKRSSPAACEWGSREGNSLKSRWQKSI